MLAPRLMTAMITPYDQNLHVNYAKAAELARYLADNGSEGIVVSGTTGESPVLTKEEKLLLFKTVKEAVGDRVKVWMGTGSNDTRQSIELSREAEKLGADGVMLVCPYYNKPTQEGLYQHFKAIAESVSLPVMLYNVPGRTASNLLPETAARLAAIENITAIKEASGDMDQISKLIRLLPDKVLVYSGDDSLTLPIMSLGGYGVISIASHLVGNDIKEMIDAFVSGDVKKAAALHLKLFPLFKGLFVTTNPIPVKEALNLRGMQVGGFRLPLTSIGEKEKEFLAELLKQYNLL
ncbi:dihydrodipicolinate synthase [Thermosyntropha lipolytica DSM 11003]|uniref:4-hydroxy-tetrahydrodipicolinate synthase n=1 Tax=Thermosyntropha lipolytica DSM 11003 TaxID=1123382 RepID=A0A1M5PWY0_9FIRM|nr:4-hydroxy-tetrahydrodipicolinate synthase [Thermosyntropha lipolytica]SHH06041.1 dihydrodipicolinate synthase [Thermosyntropha lipolytica DSM 11003]